ncbi:MAG: alpha/beta fold hydrolase [Rhodospirillaceae bacterium]|nr:alpha/beta fold hydrolase [Rhodospirillaceae bacterium]
MPAFAADKPTLRHGYADNRYGQLHYATAAPPGGGDTSKPPLVMFHQSPNSSIEFDALTAELGKDRVVYALDTPGHGGSDGPAEIPTIEELADAMHEALTDLGFGPDRPIDAFGFHTGTRILSVLAVKHPKMVRRVMMGLSGVSVVPAEESAALLAAVYHPKSAEDAFTRFCARLPERIRSSQAMGIPDLVWGKLAAGQLRGLTRYEYGHAAAFEFGTRFDDHLKRLTQPISFLVVEDGMKASGAAKKSAREMSDQVVGMMTASKKAKVLPEDFILSDLHLNAKAIADVMRRFQDEPG